MDYLLNLSSPPSVRLAGHSVCPAGWSLTGRTLDEAELIVVYSGVLRCIVGGEPHLLQEGGACFVPPRVSVDQLAEGGPCRFFYAHIEVPVSGAELAQNTPFVSNDANKSTANEDGFFFLPALAPDDFLLRIGQAVETGESKNEIFTLFQRLLLERNHETSHSLLLIALEIMQIFTLLAQCRLRQNAPLPQNPVKREQNKLVQDALLYLNSHYAAPVRVTELAESLQVSQQYLARLFKAETGLSPVKYLNRLRVEKAKECMRTGGMNISEAALSCGFDNIYYFSRLFKQLEGRPPSAYRAWLNSKSNQ